MEGSRLADIRKAKGFTQADIADVADIDRRAYSHYETNRRRPRPEVAQRIAKVLDFDWTLFYVDGEEQDQC